MGLVSVFLHLDLIKWFPLLVSIQHTHITLIVFRTTIEIKASSCLITQRRQTQKHQYVIRSLFLFFIGILYLNNVTTSQKTVQLLYHAKHRFPQSEHPSFSSSNSTSYIQLGSILDTHTQACHDNYFCWTVYCPKTVCYKQHYCLFKTILCHWYNDNGIITQVPPFKQQ